MPLPTRHGGHTLFAQYAFPPNELGYCGPPGTVIPGAGTALAGQAREFDGAWPYLAALAAAAGGADVLDEEVVHSYWVGGALLAAVDPGDLLARMRRAFAGQSTGLLDAVTSRNILAHHSFHVFVVYPWVRFLDRDPVTPLRIMQSCRIRWGTVESVDGDHAVMRTRPLTSDSESLTLGAPIGERVRWRRNGASLIAAPHPGDWVAAHWDWVCGALTDDDVTALAAATGTTLDLVNEIRTTVGAPARTDSR
ncbi:DUF6390 family protein [Mycolicibacterium baixiangningiae]|uniref:DUF6390 family protein n=1 Tax=Mycolicibacterium baixiangningiae TaxID=2761578 RepID=UPI0018D12400|nr:DUF6390 family protein [Mycolicibacterium baixiangningiae]